MCLPLLGTGSAPAAVTSLEAGGVAETAGVCVGDAILRFNDDDVSGLAQKQLVPKFKQAGAEPFVLHVKTVSDKRQAGVF